MKIRFYTINREKQGRGKLVGEVEFKDGETTVKTEDEELRRLLTTPYTTLGAGETTTGYCSDAYVTYQPDTPEFLGVLAMECWKHGYLSEMIE